MTLGIRDIGLDKLFVQDSDEWRHLRVIKHIPGFQGATFVEPIGMTIPKQEVDAWLRTHVGPRAGENFKVDRVYYKGETPPSRLSPAWQATADYWPPDVPRWNVVPTIGYFEDTIIMPDDAAILFKMLFGGELVEV